MGKPMLHVVVVLSIGLIAGFALGTKHTTIFAQQGPPSTVPPQSPQGAGGLQNHYQQLRFTLQPNEERPLALPVMDTPVRVDVSTSQFTVDCGNSTTQMLGPVAFGGVWSWDSLSGKISPAGDDHINAVLSCGSPQPEGSIDFILYNNGMNELAILSQDADPIHLVEPISVTVNMWY